MLHCAYMYMYMYQERLAIFRLFLTFFFSKYHRNHHHRYIHTDMSSGGKRTYTMSQVKHSKNKKRERWKKKYVNPSGVRDEVCSVNEVEGREALKTGPEGLPHFDERKCEKKRSFDR